MPVSDLNLLPVWVNPQHLVVTAIHIMAGHQVKALAVLNDGKLAGIVALEDLIGASENARIETYLKAPALVVPANSNVRDVAEAFVEAKIDYAPVVDSKGNFLGLLTPTMLLKELGRSYDPLTTLSWSDRLREWCIEHLKNGEEVTIIFIDLNQFGQYNKKYGHIVGDQVIRKVAEYLQAGVDPDLDVLVRFGGDEFAIGTLRLRDEADALAELLTKRFDGRMKGAEEPVSFSTGVFGGRREKEREHVHYASTVDNLINIASKNCIANKKRARGEEVESPKAAPKAEIKVLGIYSDEAVANGVTTVIISGGGNVYSGADLRQDKTIVESIAGATARAMERAQPAMTFEAVAIDLLQDEDVQVVSVTGLVRQGESERSVSAAKRVTGELANAVAEATVEAFLQ